VSTPWTGPLHFSMLKTIAESPAHFRHACDVPISATAAMRLGTLVHWFLLGGPHTPIIFQGKARRGPIWDVFERAHRGKEIYTLAEYERAEPIAEAVRNHPLYPEWIEGGDHEIALEWEMGGYQFATRGVDILQRRTDTLVDFKTARSTEPEQLDAQSRRLHYPEQIACYDEACRQNGFEPSRHAIFAVETRPPYPCTVLVIPPSVLDQARKTVALWLERLRGCVLADFWPGYVQSPVEMSAGHVELVGVDELEEVG
jgi:PDDEXK-like domain of unknown function (DUF3799)